jgi:predicted transcriptional regulator
MSVRKKKDSLEVKMNIIEHCTVSCNISSLHYSSGIGYKALRVYLEELKSKDIIREFVAEDKRVRFRTTEKGKEILKLFKQLKTKIDGKIRQ